MEPSIGDEVPILDSVSFWADFIERRYSSEIKKLVRKWPDNKNFEIHVKDVAAFGDQGILHAEKLIIEPLQTLSDIKTAITQYNLIKKKGEHLPVDIRILSFEKKTPVRLLRGSAHVGSFVSVEGVIKRVSSRRERLVEGVFRCSSGHRTVKKQPYAIKEFPTSCSGDGCKNKPLELLSDFSRFEDTQIAAIQEYIEDLSPGEQPQTIELSLSEGLIDTISAGNRVIINGILKRYQTASGKTSTVFKNYIDVNSIEIVDKEYSEIEITEEDIQQIEILAADPDIYSRLTRSLVPTIFGLENVKEVAVYQFFGGSRAEGSDGIQFRGDIHVGMFGEPGLAKTEFLTNLVKYSPRGIYTSGKGSSGVGLAVSVVKGDAGEDSWVCEPGAMALADGGVCVIDEINHLDEKEYSLLYEALERQRVSINKATIHQTIFTRCAAFFAANPIDGWFDDNIPLKTQLNMPPALLSRIDILLILRDKGDVQQDEQIVRHIIGVRSGNLDSDRFTPDISPDLFRKHVAYAKRKGILKWTKPAEDLVVKYYLSIRTTRADISTKPVPITPRQANTLARLSESSARIRLSLKVEIPDVERGIRILDKCLRDISYDAKTGIFDCGSYTEGKTRKQRDIGIAIKETIRELADPETGRALFEAVVLKLSPLYGGRDKVEKSIEAAVNESQSEIFRPNTKYLKVI